jgi:hypothetical protein
VDESLVTAAAREEAMEVVSVVGTAAAERWRTKREGVPAVTGDGRRRRRRWRLHILEWGGDRGRREKGFGRFPVTTQFQI